MLAGAASLGTNGRSPAAITTGETTVVASRGDLHRAFRNVSPGETIVISAENAPYRTTEWLDVDVDEVTVVGLSIKRLIVPSSGANVGGIRIGHWSACSQVTVRGVGYAGNPEGQDPNAKRLHGIVVRKADDVTLTNNYVTRTHPYHEHNSGGSGISVEPGSSGVRIRNNRIYDIGDRGYRWADRGSSSRATS